MVGHFFQHCHESVMLLIEWSFRDFFKVLDSKTYAVLKAINPVKMLYNSNFIANEPQIITSFQETKIEQYSTIPHGISLIHFS